MEGKPSTAFLKRRTQKIRVKSKEKKEESKQNNLKDAKFHHDSSEKVKSKEKENNPSGTIPTNKIKQNWKISWKNFKETSHQLNANTETQLWKNVTSFNSSIQIMKNV